MNSSSTGLERVLWSWFRGGVGLSLLLTHTMMHHPRMCSGRLHLPLPSEHPCRNVDSHAVALDMPTDRSPRDRIGRRPCEHPPSVPSSQPSTHRPGCAPRSQHPHLFIRSGFSKFSFPFSFLLATRRVLPTLSPASRLLSGFLRCPRCRRLFSRGLISLSCAPSCFLYFLLFFSLALPLSLCVERYVNFIVFGCLVLEVVISTRERTRSSTF